MLQWFALQATTEQLTHLGMFFFHFGEYERLQDIRPEKVRALTWISWVTLVVAAVSLEISLAGELY